MVKEKKSFSGPSSQYTGTSPGALTRLYLMILPECLATMTDPRLDTGPDPGQRQAHQH